MDRGLKEGCISCDVITGRTIPPGGIVYEDAFWLVFLRSQPLLVAGQGFIVLKRHCEHLAELDPAEAAALGLVMQRTAQAMDRTLQPVKTHFGLYAEGVKHLHLHVLPRLATLPTGNIPVTFLEVWYEALAKLHLKRPYSNEVVAEVADRLRAAFQVLSA
jgi:diadenosine tetraphosphate (Ap4A) HIT family hydrolase